MHALVRQAYLALYVCPVYPSFSDIKVKGRCLFNSSQRDGHIIAVGAQRDTPDVVSVKITEISPPLN